MKVKTASAAVARRRVRASLSSRTVEGKRSILPRTRSGKQNVNRRYGRLIRSRAAPPSARPRSASIPVERVGTVPGATTVAVGAGTVDVGSDAVGVVVGVGDGAVAVGVAVGSWTMI